MATVSFLGSYADLSSSSLLFRNRLINGDMKIDQRNNGATVIPISIGAGYTLDRWRYYVAQASKLSFIRSSIAPAGFTSSLLCTSTTTYSVLSSDLFQIGQIVEGLNAADLAWGTSDAKPITVSFWVRSSLTGLIGGAIANVDGTRSYPFSYSVTTANTWEFKQILIPGDTTGTWAKDTTQGIRLRFNLGSGTAQVATSGVWAAGDYNGPSGAINLVGTTGATLYLTGVQLEAGSQATPFEFRSAGMELVLCQRYCERMDNASGKVASNFCWGMASSTTNVNFIMPFSVQKRVVPLAAQYLVSGSGTFQAADGNAGFSISALTYTEATSTTTSAGLAGTVSGVTQYRSYYLQTVNGQTPYIIFSAEL